MIKIFIVLFMLIVTSNAKEFYYSFINSKKIQISEFDKKNILEANYKLETIKRLVREGKLNTAFKKINIFREKNKVKLLNSKAILVYAEILYKLGGVKNWNRGVSVLEKSINISAINRDDLLSAYRLLVTLTLKVNKTKDAIFYAKSIINIFDDPLSKAFGKISLAEVDIHKRNYRRAIKKLYKILVETNNIKIATVVADYLFDAYILNKQNKKAYNLVQKVLKRNIEYYANDSYLGLKKVDKLLKANMPEFAIEILKMLLKKAVEPESIDRFKFKLANTYMRIAGQNKAYLEKAKELYKDLLASKKKVIYYKDVRMSLDEILMREGKFIPSSIASRYSSSESMSQKALLQELLNYVKDKKYSYIQKTKKIYLGISDTVAKRFGFESMSKLFDIINAQMIEYYLNNDKCIELSEVLYLVGDGSIQELVKDSNMSSKFFNCLVEVPDERSFEIAKIALEKTKNANVLFWLERIAILLHKPDIAYEYVQKIDMINDEKVKEKEFLYRFLVYGQLNNKLSIKQFFRYTKKHPEYIQMNENNPLIIDFYYQYYLYLQKNNKKKESLVILKKLSNTQHNMNAFVYSPFVELELAKEEKLDDNYQGAVKLLLEALQNTRKISDNNLANIYYEMAKLYELLNKKERYKQSISKCKELPKANNFYKKMCDQL